MAKPTVKLKWPACILAALVFILWLHNNKLAKNYLYPDGAVGEVSTREMPHSTMERGSAFLGINQQPHHNQQHHQQQQQHHSTVPESILVFELGKSTNRNGFGSLTFCILRILLYYQETKKAMFVLDEGGFANYRRNATHGLYKGFFDTDFPVLDRGDNVTQFLTQQQNLLTQQQQQQRYAANTSSWLQEDDVEIIKVSHKTPAGWKKFAKHLSMATEYLHEQYGSNATVYGRLKSLACGLRFNGETQRRIDTMLHEASIPPFNDPSTTTSTVAFHIRRGDKIRKESRPYQADEYVQTLIAATTTQERSAIQHCYVATDDIRTVAQLQAELQAAFIPCQVYTMAKYKYNDKRNSQNHIITFLLDLYVMTQATYFVGTFNSNVGSFAALWRSCRHENDHTATADNKFHHYFRSYGADEEDWFYKMPIARNNNNNNHKNNNVSPIRLTEETSTDTAATELATTSVAADKRLDNHTILKETDERTVAVFYNFYMPPSPVGATSAFEILQEQINQLGNSFVVKQSRTDKYKVILYYNTIGDPRGDLHTNMTTLCANTDLFACKHLNHFVDGTFEEVTLASLSNFCKGRPANSTYDNPVLYFHNKGIFHSSGHQKQWRQNMLAAISGPECTASMSEHGHVKVGTQCNICGQQFLPIWQMAMAGNFFTAKCSYVRHLYNPVEYKQQATDIGMSIPSLGFSMDLFTPIICDVLGVGRYTSEQWLASHPNVIPCDMAGSSPLFRVHIEKTDFVEPASNGSGGMLDVAPRFKFTDPWARKKNPRDMENVVKSDYNLLPGILYRYLKLYKQLPPTSSWIWKWYPGGDFWKEMMKNVTQQTCRITEVQTTEATNALLSTIQSTPRRAKFRKKLINRVREKKCG